MSENRSTAARLRRNRKQEYQDIEQERDTLKERKEE